MRHRRPLASLFAVVAFFVLSAAAVAQPAEDAVAKSGENEPIPDRTSASAPPPPAAISISEIPSRAKALETRLRAIEADLSHADVRREIEAELEEFNATLVAQKAKIETLLGGAYGLTDIRSQSAALSDLADALAQREEQLRVEAMRLDGLLERLRSEKESWELTRDAARKANAPDALSGLTDEMLVKLAAVGSALERSRNAIVDLSRRVLNQQAAIEASEEQLEKAVDKYRAALFERQVPALWSAAAAGEGARMQLRAYVARLAEGWLELRQYVVESLDRLLLHALLTLLLYWAIRRVFSAAVASAHDAPAADGEVEEDAPRLILSHPLAATLLVSLGSRFAVHDSAPALFLQAVIYATLPPYVIVLRAILPPMFRRGIFLLVALVIGFSVYRGIAHPGFLARLWLILVLLVAIGALLREQRSTWIVQMPARMRIRFWYRVASVWIRLAVVLAGSAIVAVVFGYLKLAETAATVLILGSYVGTLFMAAARILEVVVEGMVKAGGLAHLAVLRRRPEVVVTVARRTIRGSGFVLWVYLVLSAAGFSRPFVEAVSNVLSTPIGYGSVMVSLGGLLAFTVTLWLTWQLARLTSFALEEEVFPRFVMAVGVPFALTTFTRYAILVIGFIIAMGMLGFSLDRLTLLLSAVGVGIGFGLQNVVNNFVSGIILLFERPVRVGDRVQLEDLFGDVSSIGIRASKVHTLDGADVIVPNGEFISARVINWTLSDRRRRVILPIGVAYGTNPKQVIEILERAATSVDDVLTYPAPEVLFRGFGDSALNFEIRVWTEADFLRVQSDLAIATNEALADANISIPFPQRDVHVRTIAPALGGLSRGQDDGGEEIGRDAREAQVVGIRPAGSDVKKPPP